MGTRPPISWGDPEAPWAGGHFLKCVRLEGYDCLLFGINRLDLALTSNLTYILRGTADLVRDNQQPGVPGLRLKGCGAGWFTAASLFTILNGSLPMKVLGILFYFSPHLICSE